MTDADVERVVTRTLETKPDDAIHWSARGMAGAAGLSQSSVPRLWRAASPTESFRSVIILTARSLNSAVSVERGRAIGWTPYSESTPLHFLSTDLGEAHLGTACSSGWYLVRAEF